MPKCIECEWFDKKISDCHAPGWRSDTRRVTLSRRCIFGILTKNIKMMSGKILEIGHGKVFFLRKRVLARGFEWCGLEPRWEPEPQKGRYRGSVSKMPFENSSIDFVVSSQCMEHWHELGDKFDAGLLEIHRVLKPSGLYFADVPIHSHGHILFKIGRIKEIKELFDDKYWEIVSIEEFRKEYEPLPPMPIPKRYHQYALKISNQKIPSEWILNIIVKKKELKK